MADTHRQAAIGQSSTLMLGCFTCHFTATSQLPREVNKFLLAYIIMFKRVNLRQYFIGLHEYLIAATYRIAAVILEIIVQNLNRRHLCICGKMWSYLRGASLCASISIMVWATNAKFSGLKDSLA